MDPAKVLAINGKIRRALQHAVVIRKVKPALTDKSSNMSEQQEQQKEQEIRNHHCFQSAQKHLAEKALCLNRLSTKTVDSSFLCAVWKFRAQNGKLIGDHRAFAR